MVSHKNIDDDDRQDSKGVRITIDTDQAVTIRACCTTPSKPDTTDDESSPAPVQEAHGLTFVEEKELTGKEYVTFTGIPSTVKTIRVVFYNANLTPIIRLGDASSVKSSGYQCVVGDYYSLSRKTDGFYIGEGGSTSLTCRETVDIQRSESNEFVLSGTGAMGRDSSVTYYYAGSYIATGPAIDRVQVRASAAFASGSVGLFYL